MRIGDIQVPRPLTASKVPKRSMADATKDKFDYVPKAASGTAPVYRTYKKTIIWFGPPKPSLLLNVAGLLLVVK